MNLESPERSIKTKGLQRTFSQASMKVLVSPQSVEEALTCLSAGAEIIDVKNPSEGSLGANFPWVIREIKNLVQDRALVSATLGDADYKPGTMSQAALGAIVAGADYIKVGFHGIRTGEQAYRLMHAVKRAAEMGQRNTIVVACAYADAANIGAISALDAIAPANDAGCDGIMIDTAVKDGKSLFDHLNPATLERFVSTARASQLLTALAGSITKEHLGLLATIRPDIIGVRGAVCESRDRVRGKMTKALIEEFLKSVSNLVPSVTSPLVEACVL